MNRYAITFGVALAAIGAAASGTATASVVTKAEYNQATGTMCQGALPNYEGNFRKRPLAVANEGASNAFLTCGLTSQYDSSTGGVPEVILIVTNRNAANTDMSCTLVDGYVDATVGFSDYFPQTLTVAGATSTTFDWTASTTGGTNAPVYGYPAISCNVPASFEVNVEGQSYSEEIGA
jgi:hypothetical protein